ncbi:UvrD-helicase domain-containing protein [Candidatus Babeliales bacterium]|nr:UvrD-helicase domain-containing protein [Candidatus Babeliales bacterium]
MMQIQAFKSFVDQQLNHPQKNAVTPEKGSFLVIAGAGSGKTRVITARITNLILEHGIEPSSIVALTFTNKAAQEMQHRITHFLPHMRTKPHIATFHAYCLKLLKKNTHLLNKENFTVIDAQDAQKLLQSIIKEKGMDRLFNPKQLIPLFSGLKMNDLLNIDMPMWNMHNAQQFMELFNAYEQQKKLSGYFDFDDLLYTTYQLFVTNKTFQERHWQQHRHILVDEYQDTNQIQHALLKAMTLQNNDLVVDSVCAVGDEDQSIYSWRGATIQNILDFHKEFPNTKTIKLEQNYRSTQQILDIANNVIKNNTDRNHKQLWSSSTKVHRPLLLECLSDLQESALVGQLINTLSKKESRSSIAILYRTHYQSRVLEEALIKDSIPYKIIGGIQFYERKEIKDLLAYLRLRMNPFDRISFFRVINCPLRGLGEKFEELFLETWNQNPLSPFQEIIQLLISTNQVSGKQKSSLLQFVELFNATIPTDKAHACLAHFVASTNYLTYLTDGHEKQEAEEKKENVAEFIRAADYFDQQHATGLSQFLDDIALMQEQIKQDDASVDRVHMMTLHAAKGLEFNNVILTGLEEGILPSNQSIGQDNVQEERRLFYVGITRAQEKLCIMTSKYRNVFGKLDQQRPSRFLQEIPEQMIQRQAATHWSRSGFQAFFEDWIAQKAPSVHAPVKHSPAQSSVHQQHVHSAKMMPSDTSMPFKRMQTVQHSIFGLGIAHHIEKKGDKYIVTVHFTHHGSKKIDSSFLKAI